MRSFEEYEREVMKTTNFNLIRGKSMNLAIDKEHGVWVEGNHQTSLCIGYTFEGKEINAENTKKAVGIKIDELNYLKVDLTVYDGKKYYSVSMSFKNGCLPIFIYNKGSFMMPVCNPVIDIDTKGSQLVITNKYLSNARIINDTEFTVDGFVNEICNLVRNIHYSKAWDDEIDSLFDVIKPVLTSCATDIKDYLLNVINTNVKHCQKEIDACDMEITELQKKRLRYVENYNLWKKLYATLLQNNQEELEIIKKK